MITATETDWETNETEFPHELARVMSAPPEAKEFDIDQDGAITLFDLYVTVVRNLAQSYLERELLATEHPLLDDNGDGERNRGANRLPHRRARGPSQAQETLDLPDELDRRWPRFKVRFASILAGGIRTADR